MSLGPEMTVQGWLDLGADSERVCLLWVHEPSNTAVDVFEIPRKNWIGPVWGNEPPDPSTAGFVVSWSKRGDDGEPTGEAGAACWVESYGKALVLAVQTRQHILDERYKPDGSVQMTLDDVIRSKDPTP